MKSVSYHARDACYQCEHASYGWDVEALFSTNVASLLSMIFNFVFFDALQKHEAFTAKIAQMLLFSVFWGISFDVISQVEKIRILITTIKTELELAFRMNLHLVSF